VFESSRARSKKIGSQQKTRQSINTDVEMTTMMLIGFIRRKNLRELTSEVLAAKKLAGAGKGIIKRRQRLHTAV